MSRSSARSGSRGPGVGERKCPSPEGVEFGLINSLKHEEGLHDFSSMTTAAALKSHRQQSEVELRRNNARLAMDFPNPSSIIKHIELWLARQLCKPEMWGPRVASRQAHPVFEAWKALNGNLSGFGRFEVLRVNPCKPQANLLDFHLPLTSCPFPAFRT